MVHIVIAVLTVASQAEQILDFVQERLYGIQFVVRTEIGRIGLQLLKI